LVPTNIREHGTNNIAELYAAFMGIYHAFDIRKAVFKFDGFKINQIIVKTDSSYLSETLSKHVWNWSWDAEAWAYRNARGKRRANSVIIHEIHKQIQAIAGHTKVKFWRVRREQNADADRLANIALDGRFEERYGMPLEASLPWLPWQSSSHYLTTDPKKLLVIDEVIQRLELPLEPDNQWSRSVASFLVLQIMNSVYDRISDDEPAVHSRVRAICKNGVIYSQVLKLYFGANWEVEFERGASTFGVQLFTSFSGLSKEWKKRLFEKDFDLYNLYIEIAGRSKAPKVSLKLRCN
jgi:ribonuclease HI